MASTRKASSNGSTGMTSVSVEESLNVVHRLDKRFEFIANRVAGLDKLIEDGKLSSLQAASAELASVISDLRVLKAEENLEESNSRGKPFRMDVDSLLEKTVMLNKNLEAAISHYTRSANSEQSRMDYTPLSREEIAKLLLLTTKSYQLNRITSKQKGQIKDQVCKQQPYLRLILKQDDIRLLLGALTAVAGDP